MNPAKNGVFYDKFIFLLIKFSNKATQVYIWNLHG